MVANTDPIFSRAPDNQVGAAVIGPSANTATDGTGANTYVAFTGNATDGGFVSFIRLIPVGSPAATVARVYYCTDTGTFTAGTTNTTANTAPIAHIALPAWTASQTAAAPVYDIPLNMPIEANHKLLISFGTSTGAAGTGYNTFTAGGLY